MEEMKGKQLTTERGQQVVFKFELIPSDMKRMSSYSGELHNCATYFSPFANVNQTSKRTIGGTIGGLEATWQPWDYTKRLVMAERVVKLKSKLRDPMGKQRNEVTKFIAQNKFRQEFVPPLGKYVDLLKAEPPHNTNNAWQSWFLTALAILMHYTHQNHLKAATAASGLPDSSPLLTFLKCLKVTLKCRSMVWLSEKDPYSIAYRCEKRNISNSYIPKTVRDCDDRFCHCGLLKKTTGNQGCEICTSDVMKAIKQTVASGKITPELSQFYES